MQRAPITATSTANESAEKRTANSEQDTWIECSFFATINIRELQCPILKGGRRPFTDANWKIQLQGLWNSKEQKCRNRKIQRCWRKVRVRRKTTSFWRFTNGQNDVVLQFHNPTDNKTSFWGFDIDQNDIVLRSRIWIIKRLRFDGLLMAQTTTF